MSESRDVAGILQDISVLYELSLAAGRSIEVEENCSEFLRTLMARKSLDFSSVWIRDRYRSEGEDPAPELTQIYANPTFRSPVERLAEDHPLVRRSAREPAFSVSYGQPGFEEIVTEVGIDRGAFAVYRLGEIGLLKLYSIARTTPFTRIELAKLRNVVAKFTISLEGCLDHMRVRAVEQKRRELEQQMLHAQKLESLGVLAGGVAHDFNNLLTAILGNAELTQEAVAGNAQAQAGLKDIVVAALRAADLCSQLLAYSGRGLFVTGPVCLNAVVEEMLRLTTVSTSKKAQIVRELTTPLATVDGDAAQIGQIVMNLVTNASEALGEANGRVRVCTGAAYHTRGELEEFQFGAQRCPGEYVFLEVEDDGCGMDAATLQKMFDPFFTTKFTGRGLGLAAVLGIVSGHGGAIRVRARVGEGTTVRALFPASRQGAALDRPEKGAVDSYFGRGVALIADDETVVREILARIVERLGFEVLTACDGGEALRIFEESGPEIDVVILDVTMPVMGGGEVLEHIVRARPDLPVIMTSGYNEQDSAPRSAAGFLKKPFRVSEVSSVLRAASLRRPGLRT